MKRLLVVALALCFGGLLYWLMQNKQGFILLSIDNFAVQANLWLVVLSLLVLWFVVWLLRRLLVAIFGPLAALWGQRKGRALTKSRALTRRGLEAFVSGQWAVAQKHLGKAASSSDMQLVNYVMAAQAAVELGQKDEAERWLAKASLLGTEAGWIAGLTQAKMLIRQDRLPEAVTLLRDLHGRAPHHTQALALLAEVYQQSGDQESLGKLLPDLRRYKVKSKPALQELEANYYRSLLDAKRAEQVSVGDPHAGEAVMRLWSEVPRQLRRHPDLIFACAGALEHVGESLQAESLLRGYLKGDGWEPRLIRLYGVLRKGDGARQLAFAEGWLRSHPDDPDLLLTLGRLCRRAGLWGKGRDYLEASLRLLQSPEAYAELAAILVELGEVEKSQECYRQGLAAYTSGTQASAG